MVKLHDRTRLTCAEYAQLIGVHRNTVSTWRKRNAELADGARWATTAGGRTCVDVPHEVAAPLEGSGSADGG